MQPSIFDVRPAHDGPDLTPNDHARLTGHLQKVLDLMSDRRPRTLGEIAKAVGCTEPSASARLRDLRKKKFGGYTVTRQRIEPGLFVYQVLL